MITIAQRRKTQQGVALLTVMLIMAVISVVAISMVSRQHLDVRHTSNILNIEQGYMALIGWEELAKRVLLADNNNIDALDDVWATINTSNPRARVQILQAVPVVGEFKVEEVRIEDMQGRFNVNNLSFGQTGETNVHTLRLQRLLDIRKLPVDLANQTIDWVDTDTNPSGVDGAEDTEYLNRDVPYQTANRLMTSASEMFHLLSLQQLEDGRQSRRDLARVFTEFRELVALPRETTININTVASPSLYRMIVGGMSEADAQTLYDRVHGGTNTNPDPFNDVNEFLSDNLVNGKNDNKINYQLGVTSEYFMLMVIAGNGRLKIYLSSILHRTGQGTARSVNVLHRSFGKWGVI